MGNNTLTIPRILAYQYYRRGMNQVSISKKLKLSEHDIVRYKKWDRWDDERTQPFKDTLFRLALTLIPLGKWSEDTEKAINRLLEQLVNELRTLKSK
jgi:uncharacterized protein YjcR